jgi:hypothetical protein
MTIEPVVRKAVKIRQSIHKQFCTCHNVQVFAMDGVPYVMNVDKLLTQELETLLDQLPVTTPILVSQDYDTPMDSKLKLCLQRGVPVLWSVRRPITEKEVNLLADTASTLQLSVEFPQDHLRKALSPSSGDPFSFLEMMHLAKARKITQTLELKWYPHLVHPLDMMELVEALKNYVRHVVVVFPSIEDVEYQEKSYLWSDLVKGSDEAFKHWYGTDVPNRSWVVKKHHQEELIQGLADFIKSKRLTMELVEWSSLHRVRHASNLEGHTLGMRSQLYEKGEEGNFIPSETTVEQPCKCCGKTLFI